MSEQDVLAEALHAVVERWDMCGHGSEPTECEELAAAARGYALETLDVERPTTERAAIAADRTWASGYSAGRAAALRAASPSPTPPEGLRAVLEAKHERDCSCPFDGTDPDCNLTVSGSWLGSWFAASPAPDPGTGLDVERLGLSAEQTAILRDLLASRQQTVSEWLGDALMYWGLGRAGKEYPPAKSLAPSAEPPETT